MIGIRDYLANLWTALLGRNPYRQELDGVRDEFGRARTELQEALEKVRILDELFTSTEDAAKSASRQLADHQTLVENLRKRVIEKDELIRQMQEERVRSEQEFRERVAGYSQQIASLQGRLGRRPVQKKATKTEKRK